MYKYLIPIVLLIGLTILIVSLVNKPSQTEGFWGSAPSYCSNCGDLGPRGCHTCVNCGWALARTGNASCIPGDQRGPYFASDIVSWNYGGGRYPRHPHYPHHPHRGWWSYWF